MKREHKGKLGIVGCGNMARGILAGVLANRVARPNSVFVYDVSRRASADFKKRFHVSVAADVQSIFQKTDMVLLAVKPQNLSAALASLRQIKSAPLVITILAGVPRKKVSSFLPKKTNVVRAMPNLGATVGSSFTAICGSRPSDLAQARKLFEACGKVVSLSENKMDLITVLSGSGPAYFFLLMELLTAEGVRHGLSEDAAEQLAVQTAMGASKLASASGSVKPSDLRKAVTSKGGTTEAVVNQLELSGIRKIFSDAIRRGLQRAKELGRRT